MSSRQSRLSVLFDKMQGDALELAAFGRFCLDPAGLQKILRAARTVDVFDVSGRLPDVLFKHNREINLRISVRSAEKWI